MEEAASKVSLLREAEVQVQGWEAADSRAGAKAARAGAKGRAWPLGAFRGEPWSRGRAGPRVWWDRGKQQRPENNSMPPPDRGAGLLGK